jgi:casein kinase II subunit beta
MSRQPQPTSMHETGQGDLEESEVISGTGEGDEIMEEVEEQEEGYSTWL